ncbi:MAG: hypothetical protein ACIAQF_09405, partial [Phycisphaerales bacterium JB065]
LVGIVTTLTRGDLLDAYWVRIDVWIYYSLVGVVGLFLIAASVCVVAAINPRGYDHLGTLKDWREWRNNYRAKVQESGFADGDPQAIEEAVACATCDQMMMRLAQATDWNAIKNRKRLKLLNWCFYCNVAAIGAVALLAVMHATLFLNGVQVP